MVFTLVSSRSDGACHDSVAMTEAATLHEARRKLGGAVALRLGAGRSTGWLAGCSGGGGDADVHFRGSSDRSHDAWFELSV